MVTTFFSLPKIRSAKAWPVAVFPTPEGPANKKTPMGCSGFLIPDFAARITSPIEAKA